MTTTNEIISEIMKDLSRNGITFPKALHDRVRKAWEEKLAGAGIPKDPKPTGTSLTTAKMSAPPPAGGQSFHNAFAKAMQKHHRMHQRIMLAELEPRNLAPLSTTTKFGEIVAFRVWRIREDGLLLSSFRPTVWTPRETIEAEGEIRDEFRSNYPGNGLHAWKSIYEVLAYSKSILKPQYDFRRDLLEPPAFAIAIGRVKMWGEVIEHERGFRAQFGKVESIDEIITCARFLQTEYPAKNPLDFIDPLDRLMVNWMADSPRLRNDLQLLEGFKRALDSWLWTEEMLPRLQEIYFPPQRSPK